MRVLVYHTQTGGFGFSDGVWDFGNDVDVLQSFSARGLEHVPVIKTYSRISLHYRNHSSQIIPNFLREPFVQKAGAEIWR